MSSFRNISISCPNCKADGEYRVWDSINVDLNPELKPKVMDGSVFEWTCQNCNKKYSVPYSFLYHDMTHNFMVQFDPNRSHIIPFAEYLRIKENELDLSSISMIASKYRQDHPKQNILFEKISEEKDLIFIVLEMPESVWEFTDRKYIVAFEQYLNVYQDKRNHSTNNEQEN